MTLKEIAASVGTSVSTVSRVLNQKSPTCASKELQDKIWKAAMEAGYVPNENAKLLKTKAADTPKTCSVSIVLARISSLELDPFFAELFRCLEAEFIKQHVLIDKVIYAEHTVDVDISSGDGVIILGRCSQELLDHVLAKNKNVVGIWRNSQHFNVDEIICDGKKAAEEAMRHLLSLGHRKIAYIGGCTNEQRYIGYSSVLFENNIPLNYSLVKETDQTGAQAEGAFYELMRQKESGRSDFSAIFCANDATAIRVLELLCENRRVFKNKPVSVISIDDIEEAQNTKPFLTTVRIPRSEMAHMAVLILLDRIKGGHTEIIKNEFPCRIIKRSSCFALQK